MTGTKDIDIGKIELFSTFSFFEVDKDSSDLVLKNIKNARIKGKKIFVEIAEPSTGKSNKKNRTKKRPFPERKRSRKKK